jgi:predicted ATPase
MDPLSKAETATLAGNVANQDLEQNLIDCLYHETEGNPLFIVETVRAGLPDEVRGSVAEGFLCVPRPLPSRMKDALMARVDQLSPPARALAQLAAAIGREFTFDVLREATGTGEEVLVRGLDELWHRGIVREQGQEAYDFSHDKLREVIYQDLSEARRQMLHRHVGRALERVYADNVNAVAARIAAHYERADEREEAIEYYQRAVEVALRVQCEADVTRYRQRASLLQEQVTTGGS